MKSGVSCGASRVQIQLCGEIVFFRIGSVFWQFAAGLWQCSARWAGRFLDRYGELLVAAVAKPGVTIAELLAR